MKNLKKSSKERAVFLDRDGVINKICYHDEKGIYSPVTLEEMKILPNVKEAIRKLKIAKLKVVVVSNQPGMAFGCIDSLEMTAMNAYLLEKLKVTAVYNCNHHPDYTGPCDCRKPKDGLLRMAAKHWDIDISKSFMVGDNLRDIQAGKDCQKTFLVSRKTVEILNLIKDMEIEPDYIVKDLAGATKIILKHL